MFVIRASFGSSPARTLKACALAVLVLACMASAGTTVSPIPATTITDKFLIVTDPSLSDGELLQGLAMAGYSSTEPLVGLPPKMSNCRLVHVPVANAAEKAQLLAVPGVLAVRPVFLESSGKQPYPILSNGQVVARFQPGTGVSEVSAVAAQAHCTIHRSIAGLPDAYVFDVNESQLDAYAAAALIRVFPNVRYAHASMLFKLEKHQAEAIADPLYPYQWHLHNTGQLSGGISGADLNAEPAWEVTKGAGAIVGVIDDCLQRDHEDLRDNYLTGHDYVLDTGDPSPYFGPNDFGGDPIGDFHGTCVSGIIAARDNSVGVRGVAPRAQLIGCKIGLGSYYASDQDVADAFLFAERNGAMAINNSWGGPGGAILPLIPNTDLIQTDNVILSAINEVTTNGRSGRGVLVLFSAGNEAMLLSFGNRWAGIDRVMAISATMRDDRLSCYSNFGPEVSVAAPGGGGSFDPYCYDSDIATTDVTQVTGYLPYVWIINDQEVPIPAWPIRGINEPMKFLDDISDYYCPNQDVDYLMVFGPCQPLVPDTTISDFPDRSYTHHMNGTSSACPNATGVAALVFSASPTLTAREVRNLIEHTAAKIQTPSEHFDAVTGHNIHYGHGRVDAYAAVLAARAAKNWPSPVEDIQNVSSQTVARVFWKNPDWDGNGVIDEDVAGVLVVRGALGSLNWAPVDGIGYTIGQQVAPGVVVVANDLITTLDETGLSLGTYEYALFVRNAANYYSWGRRTGFSSTGAVTVPLASIQASVTTGPAPLAVHFAGGGVDSSGIVGYIWDFGDGASGTGAAVDHTYTASGQHSAVLTVINGLGQTAQTSVVINVLAGTNSPPLANIQATPSTGEAPLRVLLEASASDSDGRVIRYDWSFGDGTVATGRVIEHVYLDPGTYGVTLTVVDNAGGEGMASVLITVTGTTTTAAETVGTTTPLCGGGTAGGLVATVMGLCGLVALRRRG